MPSTWVDRNGRTHRSSLLERGAEAIFGGHRARIVRELNEWRDEDEFDPETGEIIRWVQGPSGAWHEYHIPGSRHKNFKEKIAPISNQPPAPTQLVQPNLSSQPQSSAPSASNNAKSQGQVQGPAANAKQPQRAKSNSAPTAPEPPPAQAVNTNKKQQKPGSTPQQTPKVVQVTQPKPVTLSTQAPKPPVPRAPMALQPTAGDSWEFVPPAPPGIATTAPAPLPPVSWSDWDFPKTSEPTPCIKNTANPFSRPAFEPPKVSFAADPVILVFPATDKNENPWAATWDYRKRASVPSPKVEIWTPEEDETLCRLRRQGKTWPEIYKLLGDKKGARRRYRLIRKDKYSTTDADLSGFSDFEDLADDEGDADKRRRRKGKQREEVTTATEEALRREYPDTPNNPGPRYHGFGTWFSQSEGGLSQMNPTTSQQPNTPYPNSDPTTPGSWPETPPSSRTEDRPTNTTNAPPATASAPTTAPIVTPVPNLPTPFQHHNMFPQAPLIFHFPTTTSPPRSPRIEAGRVRFQDGTSIPVMNHTSTSARPVAPAPPPSVPTAAPPPPPVGFALDLMARMPGSMPQAPTPAPAPAPPQMSMPGSIPSSLPMPEPPAIPAPGPAPAPPSFVPSIIPATPTTPALPSGWFFRANAPPSAPPPASDPASAPPPVPTLAQVPAPTPTAVPPPATTPSMFFRDRLFRTPLYKTNGQELTMRQTLLLHDLECAYEHQKWSLVSTRMRELEGVEISAEELSRKLGTGIGS
ncbi:hypothetical protein MMC25_001694 [Agyrium rufum]|nr:hypothetical protein [Agyrium rufum]